MPESSSLSPKDDFSFRDTERDSVADLWSELRACFLPRSDLFAGVADLLSEARPPIVEGLWRKTADSIRLLPIAAFRVSPNSVITVDRQTVRPSVFQCFLKALGNVIPTEGQGLSLSPTIVDAATELTIWTAGKPPYIERVASLWAEVKSGGILDELEVLTTPKLYGSKHRITQFLFGVALATLPPNSPILDLMSGTGIVARKLASRYSVAANDANAYAALLTRAQGLALEPETVDSLIGALRAASDANLAALRDLLSHALEEEAVFLHGEIDELTCRAYSAFCATEILPIRPGVPERGSPHQLCTARYSNAYFGLAQAMEIDSLRSAVDIVLPHKGADRDVVLAALLVAACTCGSGPHFAQPPKPRSLGAVRTLIERRARNYGWEFELALRRLAARERPTKGISPVTMLDWRPALDKFLSQIDRHRPAGIYLDPPYSKLQYSRYYHVLNTLVSYNYPTSIGIGRYPPLSERFSSRFEYRARAAEREFEEVFARCSAAKLHVMLSYADRGFIPIARLIEQMKTCFNRVEVFSETTRHHSQGVKLRHDRGNTVEYVLVGRPS